MDKEFGGIPRKIKERQWQKTKRNNSLRTLKHDRSSDPPSSGCTGGEQHGGRQLRQMEDRALPSVHPRLTPSEQVTPQAQERKGSPQTLVPGRDPHEKGRAEHLLPRRNENMSSQTQTDAHTALS